MTEKIAPKTESHVNRKGKLLDVADVLQARGRVVPAVHAHDVATTWKPQIAETLLREKQYRIETLTSADITKENLPEISNFFRYLFNNEFPEYAVCKNCDIQLSAREHFGTGNSYVPLAIIDDPQNLPCCQSCQQKMEFVIDSKRTFEILEKKFKKGAYISIIREEETDTIVGLAFGCFSSLEDAIKHEWGHPDNYMAEEHRNDDLLVDVQKFVDSFSDVVKSEGYHEGLQSDTEVFFWGCAGFDPEAQGNLPALMNSFWNSLPKEKVQNPRMSTVFHVKNKSKMHGLLNECGCFDVPDLLDQKYMVLIAPSLSELSHNLTRPPENFKQFRRSKKKMNELGYLPNEFDNPKVEIREVGDKGRAVFAKEAIPAGEIIASFEGPIYKAARLSDLPNVPPLYTLDHVIQISEDLYLHGKNGMAECVNHSCEPNCGIQDKTKIVAMRDIKPDKEITWDYAMTEDSDWKMEGCQCGSPRCRGTITALRDVPTEIRKEYGGFISEWLIEKYDLSQKT